MTQLADRPAQPEQKLTPPRKEALAAQSLTMVQALNRADADSLYTAAVCRAVTAHVLRAADDSPDADRQSDVEADLAMVWLRQAVAAGAKDPTKLKLDADLDALRGRADFQELLAELPSR